MSGNSGAKDPNAKNPSFRPSKEVAEKMKPITREAFINLLRRAANSPAQKFDPRAKRT